MAGHGGQLRQPMAEAAPVMARCSRGTGVAGGLHESIACVFVCSCLIERCCCKACKAQSDPGRRLSLAAAAGCRQRAKQVWPQASQRACAVARSLAVHTVCDTHADRPSGAAFSARRHRTGQQSTRQRPRITGKLTLCLYIGSRVRALPRKSPCPPPAAAAVGSAAARTQLSLPPRCWPLCCNLRSPYHAAAGLWRSLPPAMAFQPPGPHEPPRKLDVYLEAVAAFQAGAATLQAGTALALHEDSGRLTAVTQDGTGVGLIPADKRALLSRGPWSGTVRSVKRQVAAAAAPAAACTAPQQTADGSSSSQVQQEQQGAQQQPGGAAAGVETQQQQQQQAADQPQGLAQPPAAVVVQVLVRFTPEEQRWAQRQAADQLLQQAEEEDTARLSTEQFEALGERRWGGSGERDERNM